MTTVTFLDGSHDMKEAEARVFLQAFLPSWIDRIMEKQIDQLRAHEWARGDLTFNHNPKLGDPVGWVFTDEGWKPYGKIE